MKKKIYFILMSLNKILDNSVKYPLFFEIIDECLNKNSRAINKNILEIDINNLIYGYDAYLKKNFKEALIYFKESSFKYSYYLQGLIYTHDFIGNERNYEEALNCFFLSLDESNDKKFQKYALFQMSLIYFRNYERKLAKIYFEASELEEAKYYLSTRY